MKLYSQTEIAARSGVPIPTLHGLITRGVIGRPNIEAGREGYYDQGYGNKIIRFLEVEYRRYKRYPRGYVQRDESPE